MKEREWQARVIAIARDGGFRVWHSPTPMRPIGGNKFVPDPRGRGLPDLIMLNPSQKRLVFAELKKEGGALSDDQLEFIRYAREVGAEVYVWYPEHEDHVRRILAG